MKYLTYLGGRFFTPYGRERAKKKSHGEKYEEKGKKKSKKRFSKFPSHGRKRSAVFYIFLPFSFSFPLPSRRLLNSRDEEGKGREERAEREKKRKYVYNN